MRKKWVAGFVGLALLAVAAPSRAAVEYTYFTAGSFTSPVDSNTYPFVAATTPTASTLTYTGAATETITYTDQPTTTTTANPISLGTFSLTTTGTSVMPVTFSSSFSLAVTFTEPSGTSGKPFSAELTGSLYGSSSGVTLNFSPNFIAYSNANNDASAFNLTLVSDPITITNGNTGAPSVTVLAYTPEPATAGLLAIASPLLIRRRRTA